MPFVSIARLRVRSWSYVPAFVVQTLRIARQAIRGGRLTCPRQTFRGSLINFFMMSKLRYSPPEEFGPRGKRFRSSLYVVTHERRCGRHAGRRQGQWIGKRFFQI